MKDRKLLKPPLPKLVNRLQSILSSKKGWIAAIESESGKYVLGKTLIEAAKRGREKFPGKIFYFIRIGYPYVHRQTGGLKKVKV